MARDVVAGAVALVALDDRLVLPASLDDPRPIAQRDLGAWPAFHRRAVSLQRDQVVADAGNLLDQVLTGRIVPAVNGVGVEAILDPG